MGVEFYLTCKTCMQYIDLHKAYDFHNIICRKTPPVGYEGDKEDLAYYWDGRGIWFLWNHREHKLEMNSDSNDGWYDLEPKLSEVFPHKDDLELRKNKQTRDEHDL